MEEVKKRPIQRSISSEGYDSMSYSYSMDNVSTNSFSEQNLDEIEENEKEDKDETDHCKIYSNSDKICDLRQSLTDDEKTKINEKNRRKEEETSRILEDALRIYRKYLVTSSQYFVELPATILSNLSLALCTNTDIDCDARKMCQIFQEAQTFMLDFMEKNFLTEFLESDFYAKYTIDVLTSNTLKLCDILYSETALFYFMEFLEQDTKRSLLEFWLAATNFKKLVIFEENLRKETKEKNSKYIEENARHSPDGSEDTNSKATTTSNPARDQIQSDALVIYEKYFSLLAKSPLNLPQQVRMKVEEAICSPDTISECFDFPISIIEDYLEKSCLSKFLKSPLFFKYLSELMNKIQDNKHEVNGIMKVNRHRKTYSDCTSEKVRPIRNTLLAMETRTKSNANDMQIDARKIQNPDLLWKRQNAPLNGLSFGRVNALGRYERDFDMNPQASTNSNTGKTPIIRIKSLDGDPSALLDGNKWNTLRIKNAVRKLVHLPQDEVQEELAWAVAEMIVKDITSVTLNSSEQK